MRAGFRGCIKDFKILTAIHPEEVWTPIDWTAATERSTTMNYWEGCPFDLEENAVHFLGDGR